MENQNRLKERIFRVLRSPFGSCKSRNTSDIIAGQVFSPQIRQNYQLIQLFSPRLDPFKCPPASPISPLNAFHEFEKSEPKPTKKKTENRKNKSIHLMKTESFENYYDDKTTIFSSHSSDSSENRGNYKGNRRRSDCGKESEMGLMRLQGKVSDSFAVRKRSSDPYSDFRCSMVEMIVEKQIFGARDLENLLQTFLSLNSCHHHRVINEVFTEIWEALFFN
ncbi:hypothetical protein Acr_00g0071720 [Actinidia rufa]|uniref:Transcription repressor n=1 Tax=Actinidia rufa TaxID=165716 RepID=A0A7J0DSZ2_9ERIC|nr:hypothetical protein Acr_00g0071720 [Actinidia rufa]